MMMTFLTLPWLAAAHLAQPQPAPPLPEPKPPDPLCQQLFDTYVRGLKISTDDRYAAYHLIASRGRNCGFADVVLDEWRRSDAMLELGCVTIIGKMLETDARARVALEAQKKGEYRGAWMPSIELDDTVVPELIERAQKQRFRDTYIIAISRACDPRARTFLQEVLTKSTRSHSSESERFHTAVGLVRLADPAGVQWMINHVDDQTNEVMNAWPQRITDIKVGTCCRAVLRDLSDLPMHLPREKWEEWWSSYRKTFTNGERIRVSERY